MGTDEYNRKNYDQVIIRFPKGTKTKFKNLFKNSNMSFNAWVVSLVTTNLLKVERYFSED